MIRLKTKAVSVMEESWDFLIVLDACRYDYFREVYEEFFLGELEKRMSLGRCTTEWLKNNFKGYYHDIIYISGNPYINSKIEVEGFKAKRHFYKVVDVWSYGWNEKLGTVLPEEINKAAVKYYLKYPGKRFILHYMQPHAPYLSVNASIKGYGRPKPQEEAVLHSIADYKFNIVKALI